MSAKPVKASLKGASWLARPALQQVLKVLEAQGGEARVAGGAVRNGLLGEPVADIDIATTHPPDRVTALCRKAGLAVHPTGLDHGTVTVVAGKGKGRHPFEVTTLRVDTETYGRRAKVAFTADWQADAGRRDFTINALYCDRHGAIFDPLGGLGDLKKRRVRFVGDARQRIREDYLRILRFFRFHARYGRGRPDTDGLAAAVDLADGLSRLSAERIRAELLKLFVTPRAAPTVKVMAAKGILARLWPGPCDLARFARMARLDERFGLTRDPLLRLAALWLAQPGDARRLFERLRLSGEELRRLKVLEVAGPLSPALRERERRILAYQMGSEAFRDAVRLAWAGRHGRHIDGEWRALLAFAESWKPPRLPVKGEDLVARGIAPGPRVGKLLGALEDWWVASDFAPRRKALLARLDILAEGR
jgi:poly(A) polymerase